ncbi:MAG TPA: prolipoprotein diacylglyceryl transferase [Xanthomonadaceae bacterium]|nr:prolipoprotein diacylglyceryl transferase [Xanthomonadaceae bacterium]
MIQLHQIDPIAVALGPLKVHWYGLMYLLAFGTAWFLGRSRVRAGRLPGVGEAAFSDLMFYGMLGVVLGGRIGYVLFYAFVDFLQDPLMLLKVWQGGMSFHGGLLGVLAALAWWSRRHRLHFFDTVDFVAPLVPAGLGFGRLGNYIGGELWGKPTDAGWGVVFPQSLPPELAAMEVAELRTRFDAGMLDAFARHPSQLYQATLEGLLLFAILWIYSKTPKPRYAVSGWFGVLYGAFRFMVEFLREPDPQLGYLAFGCLTMGQLLSLPVIAVGLWLLWRSKRAPVLQPAAAVDPA